MELKTQTVYVAVLLVCSLIASSEAITCYKCDSTLESGCSDPFNSDGIKNCTGNVCSKAKGPAGGITVVIRDCVNVDGTPINECAEVTTSQAKGFGCSCTSDLCNNAKSIIPSSASLLAVVGVLSMSSAIRN